MAPAFETWFRKSGTTRIGTLFNETYNKVNHSIPSAKNQRKWFMKLGTSNFANYSMCNPKHSAKDACRTGTSASSIARAGTSCETEQRRTINLSSTPSISSRFLITTQRNVDPTGTVIGRSQGITRTSLRTRSRRNAKRRISWVSTTSSSETRSSVRTCLTSVPLKKMCREMDKLANENHTAHITPEEIRVYRNNWWMRSNTVGSDTMPVRHRPDFKQALSTLRQLKHQEDTVHQQRWKSYSSSWWNWQESWWHSSYEHHHEDGPSPDRSGKPVEKWLGYLFEVWFSEFIWCITTVYNLVTANRSLLSTTGVYTLYLQYSKILRKMATMKTMATAKAMRTSVRRTAAIITNDNWNDDTNPMTTLKHFTCTSTDAWRTCTETARASLLHTWWWHRTPHGSSSERISHSSMVIHMAHPPWLASTFLLPTFSSCPRLPLPPWAVPWAPRHVMANLRCSVAEESEDTPELLHLSHRRRMVTTMQWLYWKIHDSWVAYFRTLSCRNLHAFFRKSAKSWDQFDVCNSQKRRCVSQTSEKAKVHRSEWLKSKILISAVRTPQNLRIGLRKRLRDKSDVPAETGGDWPEVSRSSRKRTKVLWNHIAMFGAPSVVKLEEREFVADSGTSMHMLSWKDLNSAELESVRVSQNPTNPNGEV